MVCSTNQQENPCSLAANGKRVSSTVPYGYMKSPEDKEKWIIDEEAAEIVRKIFFISSCRSRHIADCCSIRTRKGTYSHRIQNRKGIVEYTQISRKTILLGKINRC